MQKLFDVIVIGGGGSGLAAGVSAAQNGASVILFEKRPKLGGSTGIAIGSFTANRTIYQDKEGIADSPEDHEADAGLFGQSDIQARNNSRMRKFFLEHSADSLHWLMEMGMRFYGPSPEPPNRVPRMHNAIPNAKSYIATLQSRFITLGGTIMCNTLVEDLVLQAGRVIGINARFAGKTITFTAKRGVVLAAGDYTNSPELIGRYKGPRFTNIEGINPHATGEGHFLAERVGAKLLNMDITYGPEIRFVPPPRKPFSQLLPAAGLPARLAARLLPLVPQRFINAMIKRLLVTWQHPEDKLFAEGAVLINTLGERFCNEKMTPEREIAIAEQAEKVCYLLLDRRLIQLFSEWPYYISTAPEIAYAYAEDYRRMRPDITVVAPELDWIAKSRGLSLARLQSTVKVFNRYACGEAQDPFGRTDDSKPLENGQWMLIGPAKAYFSTAEGGVAINTSFQVLNTADQPIEGLYAAGSNGLSGMVLWGHGLHIAWAITSGRLLGEQLGRAKNF